jgi:hypothetical protein
MFNSSFEEASQNSAIMLEDGPAAFDLLIGYIYTGVVQPRPQISKHTSEDDLFPRLSFYFLAGKICLFELMDIVMDMTIEKLIRSGSVMF